MPDEKNNACDFAIFGVLGDLSRRKLLPSLYQLDKEGLLHPDTRILGGPVASVALPARVGRKWEE